MFATLVPCPLRNPVRWVIRQEKIGGTSSTIGRAGKIGSRMQVNAISATVKMEGKWSYTGPAGRIGRAAALAFSHAGVRVAVADVDAEGYGGERCAG